jgi:hypothetical protein
VPMSGAKRNHEVVSDTMALVQAHGSNMGPSGL